MPDLYQRLSHTRWDCKFHVVFVPKYRRKAIYEENRAGLGAIFHELARQKECRIVEGHLVNDDVHMCIEIAPKFAVASVVGFLKGNRRISTERISGREGTLFPRWDSNLRRYASTSESRRRKISRDDSRNR